FRHVLHEDRDPARLGAEDDVLDIRHRSDQADAADVDRLLAGVDRSTADIDIGVADGGQHLRQRHVVGIELVEIDLNIVGFGRAAPRDHLDHAWNRQQPTLHDPVLQRAQIGQTNARGPDQLVAVDLADEARALDIRRRPARQTDVLLQANGRLRFREVVIDAIVEPDPDEGQSVERGRANDVDTGGDGEADLHGNRVIALHLLGGQARGLGGDFEDDWRRVRVGLDIELGERQEAAADEYQQAEEDDRTAGQREREQSL